MARDVRKLRVFAVADELVCEVYRLSLGFGVDERYGLQAQLRRAAVSAVTNIVEGSARRTTREYVNFLNVAAGSASETWYLLGLASRLELLDREQAGSLANRYDELTRSLLSLIQALTTKQQHLAAAQD